MPRGFLLAYVARKLRLHLQAVPGEQRQAAGEVRAAGPAPYVVVIHVIVVVVVVVIVVVVAAVVPPIAPTIWLLCIYSLSAATGGRAVADRLPSEFQLRPSTPPNAVSTILPAAAVVPATPQLQLFYCCHDDRPAGASSHRQLC